MSATINPGLGGRLAVMASSPESERDASRLAQQLHLAQIPAGGDPLTSTVVPFLLVVGDGALALQQTGKKAPGPVVVDFGSEALNHRRRSGSGELLGRAVGYKPARPLTVLDATAGLGRDAFVLACLGNEVRLCERNPVVVELLRSGLEAANGASDESLCDITRRMSLFSGDARRLGEAALRGVDVIYLDPMFPARLKSAAVKKEMALLQKLLESSDAAGDAEELLAWATGVNVPRVVVKRPVKAPSLEGPRPSHSISGKTVRYDVYINPVR